jgi:cytochrome c-type biogenesis protein CcmH/NrfG
MNYGKGLIIALVFDLAWLMGSPAATMGPDPMPPVQEVVADWPAPPHVKARAAVANFERIGHQEDSLMTYLQAHPSDVDAMAQLAHIYAEHEWFVDAIGPLARALQLDPSRRALWSALDRAVDGAGIAKIGDAELTRRAQAFVESVEMWGHSC